MTAKPTAGGREMTAERLFDASIPEPNSGCWIWERALFHNGYGSIRHNKKNQKAHRVSWIIFKGPIPPKKHVLHKCDTPACINPNHLFIGTDADNVTDMAKKGRSNYFGNNARKVKTHCKRGHRLHGSNLRLDLSNGWKRRVCRACARRRDKQRYWAKKLKERAGKEKG